MVPRNSIRAVLNTRKHAVMGKFSYMGHLHLVLTFPVTGVDRKRKGRVAWLSGGSSLRRRMKEREAVALTDDGQAAPLYPKGLSYGGGVLHGTDALDPSPVRRWKATAVISMLDKKCGEDTFKKLLERLVMNAINSEFRGAGFDSLPMLPPRLRKFFTLPSRLHLSLLLSAVGAPFLGTKES